MPDENPTAGLSASVLTALNIISAGRAAVQIEEATQRFFNSLHVLVRGTVFSASDFLDAFTTLLMAGVTPPGIIAMATAAAQGGLRVVAPRTEAESGAGLIAAERMRQQTVEGYTPAGDVGHAAELAAAAIGYAGAARHEIHGVGLATQPPIIWPWERRFWKPTGDPVRDLTKAGALIAAALDALLAERTHSRDSEAE